MVSIAIDVIIAFLDACSLISNTCLLDSTRTDSITIYANTLGFQIVRVLGKNGWIWISAASAKLFRFTVEEVTLTHCTVSTIAFDVVCTKFKTWEY
jgi:exosome complex RNA-binding protein Rrp4